VGASAEFGNIQGAVFNVVTKQGGNAFRSDASYYWQGAGLTAQPLLLPVQRGTQPESGYERAEYRDFTTNLGGPVVRNRAWFFAGYQHLRDYDSQPGTDPAFPRQYAQDKLLGKLTWQIAPSLRLLSSFHNEFWVNPERPTLVTPFETTLRFNGTVPTTTFAHVTYTPSSNTLLDARVGRFVLSQNNDPVVFRLSRVPHARPERLPSNLPCFEDACGGCERQDLAALSQGPDVDSWGSRSQHSETRMKAARQSVPAGRRCSVASNLRIRHAFSGSSGVC
jgi:hypothetical protein